MEKITKRDQIETILKEKPQATRKEVSEAIGKEVFGPEISHVRKKLQISFKRTGRPRGQALENRRKVIATVPSGRGTVLIGAVLDLAKEHGADNVRRAADLVATF